MDFCLGMGIFFQFIQETKQPQTLSSLQQEMRTLSRPTEPCSAARTERSRCWTLQVGLCSTGSPRKGIKYTFPEEMVQTKQRWIYSSLCLLSCWDPAGKMSWLILCSESLLYFPRSLKFMVFIMIKSMNNIRKG